MSSVFAERASRTTRGILDAASWLLSEHVARVSEGGAAGWGVSASRRAYRCADGRLLTLAAAEPRPWRALCAALRHALGRACVDSPDHRAASR